MWHLGWSFTDLRRALGSHSKNKEREVRREIDIQDVARPAATAKSVCLRSGLFDAEWYLAQHPDVAAAGIDPLDHFIASGGIEGRDPNPLFDSDWYLAQYPEVASARLNPLVDYVLYGVQAGREPNPYFDGRWYLEQNQDVAVWGQNPLTHYLRWGAAKGLDPSPRFATTWYLERHPDVAAAGVNPLAHYLRWGREEDREPVSPIPALFEQLARRRHDAPEDFDWLRRTYGSPLEGQPDKARGDNNTVVGVAWAEHFMSRSLDLYERGDSRRALHVAKYAAQTLPHEDDPMRLYCHLFEECNRPALEQFVNTFSGVKMLVLHVSYKGGLERAEASCRSFSDPSGRIGNVIVIGDASAEDCFHFDPYRAILTVPAPDAYEALPRKVSKALLFVGMSRLSLPVLKVDDDASCDDVEKLASLIDGVFSRHMYGGRVNPRASTASCAFWHFGKCADDEINRRPDGLLWLAPYAGGQGYWLNGRAAGAMAKMCVLHERYFEVEYFEDRAVGTVLAQYGLCPHHFDVIAQGLISDHNQPLGRGKPRIAKLRGALDPLRSSTPSGAGPGS